MDPLLEFFIFLGGSAIMYHFNHQMYGGDTDEKVRMGPEIPNSNTFSQQGYDPQQTPAMPQTAPEPVHIPVEATDKIILPPTNYVQDFRERGRQYDHNSRSTEESRNNNNNNIPNFQEQTPSVLEKNVQLYVQCLNFLPVKNH